MNTEVFQVNTEVFQVNIEVSQLKYAPPHTPDSSGILNYSHPSALNAECCSERESPNISLFALVNNNRIQASQAIGCVVADALSAVSDR